MKNPTTLLAATVLALTVSPFFPSARADSDTGTSAVPSVIVDTQLEPVTPGKFQPTWDSLQQYQVPEWFRDAKFGLWAHWGPQCQPEDGDWYAREMYLEGSGSYKSHLKKYGHPSKAGFKDVIHEWKAENWNPEKLVALYKRAGAQYFFAMANHHDNLDLWESKYQPWNSVKVGPKKDIITGWARAAKANGLPFGLSVHSAHAFSFYEPAQGADKDGPEKGVPYDGKLTKADGKGQWWDGLDPQDLYAQNHTPSENFQSGGSINGRWNWGGGAAVPDLAYCQNFYNRTSDLIRKFQPDLLYFDDTALPLWPISDAGLQIAANFYNSNMAAHQGRLQAVLFGKVLSEDQRKALTWDVERGVADKILPQPWQTDTCIGSWHYKRSIYENNGYKDAKTVIQMLADIVSKNGNLLLNIPVRGDGTIDDKELKIVQDITVWMDVNKGAILATRPWKIFGEGPASGGAPINAQGFNEGKGKKATAEDVRFTTSKDGKTLNIIVMGWPEQKMEIKALGLDSGLLDRKIVKISLLGSKERVRWLQGKPSLTIEPIERKTGPIAVAAVFQIALQ